MNAWDLDPDLYASLWRLLRKWYLGRRQRRQTAPKPVGKPKPHAGCRA